MLPSSSGTLLLRALVKWHQKCAFHEGGSRLVVAVAMLMNLPTGMELKDELVGEDNFPLLSLTLHLLLDSTIDKETAKEQ